MSTVRSVTILDTQVLKEFRFDQPELEVFDSHCRHETGLFSATRRVRNRNWIGCNLVFGGVEMAFGEDPRVFSYRGRPAAYSCVYRPGFDFRNHLFEYIDGQVRSSIVLTPKTVPPGKNWSPFTFRNGDLGFIHSFDPLIVLREQENTSGVILVSAHQKQGVGIRTSTDGFSILRGGSNGVTTRDHGVLGFGHVNVPNPGIYAHEVSHRPFLWTLDEESLSLSVTLLPGLFEAGFDIVDPTSLIENGDNTFSLFTCESQTNWAVADQHGRCVRYTVLIE